jgi:uncharacterized protein (TIRG00374 family)
MQNKKGIIKFLLFAAVGAIIVYFISKSFNFNEFIVKVKTANLGFVLASLLVGVLAVFVRALRWQLMLKPLGYKTKISNAYHSTMSGYLVNLGIPRSGEIYRCAVFSKSDQVPINTLVGTVFSERIIDLLMLAIVIFLSVIVQFDKLYNYIDDVLLSKLNGPILITLGLVMIIGIIGLVIFVKKFSKSQNKIIVFINGFINGIKSVFTLEQPILFLFYTVSIWMCYLFMTYFAVMAFDFSAVLGIGGALSTLVFSTLGVIVPAPAGIATISSIQIGLTQIYGFTEVNASTLGVVMFFSNILMIIISGSISFIIMAIKTKV